MASRVVAPGNSDHNYDSGSLYVDGDTWTVYAPTEVGPQEWGTGGEMAIWESTDQGQTWAQRVQVTEGSVYNHTYARRPLDRQDPFFALWADGDPRELSPSQIYFGASTGRHWQLPYTMLEDAATPFRQCLQPDDRPTVVVGDQDSGVANRPAWSRCAINDVIEDDLSWQTRGVFIAHVTDVTNQLVDNGTMTPRERDDIIAAAGRTNADDLPLLGNGIALLDYVPFVGIQPQCATGPSCNLDHVRRQGNGAIGASGGCIGLYGGRWRSTDAVTSVTFRPNDGATFTEGSVFELVS